MRFESKLTGFDELSKNLKALPDRVQKNVIGQASLASMRQTREKIKSATPTHHGERSPASKTYGTARQNIRLFRLKRIQGGGGARVDTGDAFWMYIYELGSRYQPARPWFANAFQAISGAVLSVLGTKLGEGIDKEFIKDIKR